MEQIEIGIVDDHQVVRSGLRDFLNSYPDLQVTCEGSNGRDALTLAAQVRMDVLVMDLCMPGQNGIDALARIRAKAPDLGVLILSGYPESVYALSLIEQGASGFLNKDCEPEDIVKAVRAVADGQLYLTTAAATLVKHHPTVGGVMARHEALSQREFQVFLKLAMGRAAKEIAQVMALSPKAVSNYRARILGKMGMHNTNDLAQYARSKGLIS